MKVVVKCNDSPLPCWCAFGFTIFNLMMDHLKFFCRMKGWWIITWFSLTLVKFCCSTMYVCMYWLDDQRTIKGKEGFVFPWWLSMTLRSPQASWEINLSLLHISVIDSLDFSLEPDLKMCCIYLLFYQLPVCLPVQKKWEEGEREAEGQTEGGTTHFQDRWVMRKHQEGMWRRIKKVLKVLK